MAAIGLTGDVLVRARGGDISSVTDVISTHVLVVTEGTGSVSTDGGLVGTSEAVHSTIISIITARGSRDTGSIVGTALHGSTDVISTYLGSGRAGGISTNVIANVDSARVVIIAHNFCETTGSISKANCRSAGIGRSARFVGSDTKGLSIVNLAGSNLARVCLGTVHWGGCTSSGCNAAHVRCASIGGSRANNSTVRTFWLSSPIRACISGARVVVIAGNYLYRTS